MTGALACSGLLLTGCGPPPLRTVTSELLTDRSWIESFRDCINLYAPGRCVLS